MLNPNSTTLPADWAGAFVLALRTRDVTGPAIGDALRHTESFCADSGQSPQEAFGDPGAYADSLTDLPTHPKRNPLTQLAPTLLGLAGMLLFLPAFTGARFGTAVEVPIGMVLVFAEATLLAIGLSVRPSVLRRRWMLAVLLTVVFGLSMAVSALAMTPVVTLPAHPSVALAAVALIVSGIWSMRSGPGLDVITDPLAPGAGTPTPGWLRLGLAWMMPAATVLLTLVSLTFPAPAP